MKLIIALYLPFLKLWKRLSKEAHDTFTSRQGQRPVDIYQDIIFTNPNWTQEAEKRRIRPVLIGDDLRSLRSKRHWKGPKFIALAVPDEDGEIAKTKAAFFKSLRPHTYNKEAKEVTFKRHNVVLNIAALDCEEVTELRDPIKLFSLNGGVSTTVLYLGHHQLEELGSDLIGGIYTGSTTSAPDIKNFCAIQLRLWNEQPWVQEFQKAPGDLRLHRIDETLHFEIVH